MSLSKQFYLSSEPGIKIFWQNLLKKTLRKKPSRSVGFEPTPAERNWFLVSRLNHSATTAFCLDSKPGHIQLYFWIFKYNKQAVCLRCHLRFYGVMVSTQDSESCDPSSNLGGTWFIFLKMENIASYQKKEQCQHYRKEKKGKLIPRDFDVTSWQFSINLMSDLPSQTSRETFSSTSDFWPSRLLLGRPAWPYAGMEWIFLIQFCQVCFQLWGEKVNLPENYLKLFKTC